MTLMWKNGKPRKGYELTKARAWILRRQANVLCREA
jgi:hypothetical protein